MTDRLFASLCLPRRLALAVVLLLAAALLAAPLLAAPLLAAEPETLARSETPQTLEGEGDRVLLVEGPFSLKWESSGDFFSIQGIDDGQTQASSSSGATVLLGPEKPEAGAVAVRKASGSFSMGGAKRYRVAITASGPWSVTVTW